MERTGGAWMPVATLLFRRVEADPRSARPSLASPATTARVVDGTAKAAIPATPTASELPAASTPPTAPALAREGTVGPGVAPVNLPATNLALKPAPLMANDFRFPTRPAPALRLADARPLIVAEAQAGVRVSVAEFLRTKRLRVPTFNPGFDYLRHGGGPTRRTRRGIARA